MEEENYSPRTLGTNRYPCYICNYYNKKNQPDMAAYVDNEEAGRRIINMYSNLGLHAQLDFRPAEPLNVQIKVGACLRHLENLRKLEQLIKKAGRIITPGIIQRSVQLDE